MRALIFTGANAMDRADHAASEEREIEQNRASVLIPVIKGWITELSVSHCSDGVQIHGGMGYAEETTASRLWIDSRVLSIFEGTEETLALKVVGRALLDRAA